MYGKALALLQRWSGIGTHHIFFVKLHLALAKAGWLQKSRSGYWKPRLLILFFALPHLAKWLQDWSRHSLT